MKKKILFAFFAFFMFIFSIKAVSIMVNPDEIEPQTYVIGTHIFNRNTNAIYDGKLTTERIMVAAKTIPSEEQEDQLIYYKKADGSWINALTGEPIEFPSSGDIEITKINLLDPEVPEQSSTFLDGETFAIKIRELAGGDIGPNSNIYAIEKADELDSNITLTESNKLSGDDEETPIYGWFDEGILYYYSEATTLYLNEDASYMFAELRALETIDLSPFYFSKVVNMEGMFKNCSVLTYLSFYDVNTINVTNMSYLFAGCTDLTTVSMSGFSSDHLLNMSHMFDGCESMMDIFLSMDTSNVTDMSYMFKNCIELATLDLSGLDLSKADVTNMFEGDNNLTTLITPKVNPTSSITLNIELYDEDLNKYEEINSTTPTEERLIAIATFLGGQDFNAKIKSIAANSSVEYTTANTTIVSVERAYDIPEGKTLNNNMLVSTENSSNPIYAWFEDGAIKYYSKAITLYIEGNASYMFSKLRNVENIDLSTVDTSLATDMSFMFRECMKITVIDASNFDTSNVTNMHGMFYKCNKLSSLNVGNFTTDKVTNMASMFAYCEDLNGLYLDNFNTSSVTNMQEMFYNCSSLTELSLQSFDTTKVTNMSNMFAGCSSITALDISWFNLSSLTSANHMFEKMASLDELVTPSVNANTTISLIAVMTDSDGHVYGSLKGDTPTSTRLTALTTMASGQIFNEKIKLLAGNEDATIDTVDNNITAIERVNSTPTGMTFTDANLISAANSPIHIYAWFDNGTIKYYSEATHIYLNGNSNYMFANLSALTKIDLGEFDAAAVDSANNMLSTATAITELVTPRVKPNISIWLPKTMYLEGNSTGISSIDSTTPTQAILKNVAW